MTKTYKVNGSQDGMIIYGIKKISESGNTITFHGHLSVILTRKGKTVRRFARTVWSIQSDLHTEVD